MTHWSSKLVSCFWRNCHNIRVRFPNTKENAGAVASTSGRAKCTHPPADEGDSDDGFEGTVTEVRDTDIAEIACGVDVLGPKTKGKGKG